MRTSKRSIIRSGDHESSEQRDVVNSIRGHATVPTLEQKWAQYSAHSVRGKTAPYAVIEMAVWRDVRLNPRDILVYLELAYVAGVSGGCSASLGCRLIAKSLKFSEGAVKKSLRNLEGCGHIRSGEQGRGRRGIYILESERFGNVGYTQKSGVPYIAKMPKDGAEQRPAVRSAPKGWRKEKAG